MPQDIKSSPALSELASVISSGLGSAIERLFFSFGELTVESHASEIVAVLRFLRDHPRCRFIGFIDLCGVDWPGRTERFDVVYHLLSPRWNARVRVKIRAAEETPVPSVTSIFPGAEWFEREAYDMYGILFAGLLDHRRILTDYGFDGYPLRKDFPLTGHLEVRYDADQKRVVTLPVSLSQAFRTFDFLTPWEGPGGGESPISDFPLHGSAAAARDEGEKNG